MPVNAVNRYVPSEINGVRIKPFKGDLKTPPEGRKRGSLIRMKTPGESKLLSSIKEAVKKIGLEDGMTISFHHHLRNGDYVVNLVMKVIEKMGFKQIKIAPTALFPVHKELIPIIEKRIIKRIEGSMNGPIGEYVSYNGMDETVILRSHSSRVRAIESGELPIDVAFIAASSSDIYGDLNGINGPSVFGPMSYAMADAEYADHVIAITDYLVPYPNIPISIWQHHVDYVVKIPRIGDPSGITTGTLRITTSPRRLKIAKYTAEIIDKIALKDGVSFQAGSGGVSLAAMMYIKEIMKKKKIKASYVNGGITKYIVEMLHEGLINVVIDGQAFDLESIKSLKEDYNHIEKPEAAYGNPYSCGGVVDLLDFAILSATEVDIDFNVNVNTHSDGKLLHGIGGHQEVAAGSALTIVTVPLYRYRIPSIRDKVTTITTPGDLIDIVVTEYGATVNPKRDDILDKLRRSNVPLWDIQDLKKKAYTICGKPDEPKIIDEIIAAILWRDGTLLDVVYKLKK